MTTTATNYLVIGLSGLAVFLVLQIIWILFFEDHKVNPAADRRGVRAADLRSVPGRPSIVTRESTKRVGPVTEPFEYSVITHGPASLVETDSPSDVGVIVNPTAVHAGLRGVATTGSGFGPNDVVNLYWDSTASTPLGTVTADSSGAFSTMIRIPETTLGTHLLIAVDTTSGAQIAAELFLNLH
jgi:hypothetical protein